MGALLKYIEYIFPKRKVSNTDLKNQFPDYDFDKFENKVGILNRYWVDENQTALDLAIEACEKMFEKTDKNEIDYLIYCTQSPEYFLPTSACVLQDKLGLKKSIGAFDYNLGCSGYVYGLSLAKALIESDQAEKVLLVTAETYSKFLHPNDKSNRAIFGDAASASLIVKSETQDIKSFLFGTDGSGYDKLIVRNGGAKNKYDSDPEEKMYGSDNGFTDNHLYMNGPEVFNFTNEVVPNFTNEVLKKNNLTVETLGNVVFHQANKFMLNFMRKRMKIAEHKFFIDLEDGGNTVSNTIPIALKKWSKSIKEPIDDVVLIGFGVGLSWAGGVINIKDKL